eukprot:Ihof_evm3s856 gene=Ihof_evmTU3s856
MVQRVSYRRRTSYNTKSNVVRMVKTPGGKLTYLYVKKSGTRTKCGDCGGHLQGIPAMRPKQLARLSITKKHVTRSYGGSRCSHCVKE